jgi:ferric-dicitrate binding protein FerR (iron transport regulator)
MSADLTEAQIYQIAKDWVIKLKVAEQPDSIQPELNAWLEANPEHLAAYRRADASMRMVYAAARNLGPGAGRKEFEDLCQLLHEVRAKDPKLLPMRR